MRALEGLHPVLRGCIPAAGTFWAGRGCEVWLCTHQADSTLRATDDGKDVGFHPTA